MEAKLFEYLFFNCHLIFVVVVDDDGAFAVAVVAAAPDVVVVVVVAILSVCLPKSENTQRIQTANINDSRNMSSIRIDSLLNLFICLCI